MRHRVQCGCPRAGPEPSPSPKFFPGLGTRWRTQRPDPGLGNGTSESNRKKYKKSRTPCPNQRLMCPYSGDGPSASTSGPAIVDVLWPMGVWSGERAEAQPFVVAPAVDRDPAPPGMGHHQKPLLLLLPRREAEEWIHRGGSGGRRLAGEVDRGHEPRQSAGGAWEHTTLRTGSTADPREIVATRGFEETWFGEACANIGVRCSTLDHGASGSDVREAASGVGATVRVNRLGKHCAGAIHDVPTAARGRTDGSDVRRGPPEQMQPRSRTLATTQGVDPSARQHRFPTSARFGDHPCQGLQAIDLVGRRS